MSAVRSEGEHIKAQFSVRRATEKDGKETRETTAMG